MIFCRVKETLIGLVDGWASTQLLTKTKGYWKMSIVIFLHRSKLIWIGGYSPKLACFLPNPTLLSFWISSKIDTYPGTTRTMFFTGKE